ncbi:molybdopterin-dependent oxidoreductase [Streptomyces pacificus]|nr:molybdopterin-dependent oxidoreductase [Streptomyces pacificus]
MPLEALRYPLTPLGLHDVLVHCGTPATEAADRRLTVGGLGHAPLRLDLRDLRAFPPVTLRATVECAGSGRALLSPRPVSRPWLVSRPWPAEAPGRIGPEGRARSGLAPVARAEASADHGRDLARGGARRGGGRCPDPAPLAHGVDGHPLAAMSSSSGPPTQTAAPTPSTSRGTGADSAKTRCSGSPSCARPGAGGAGPGPDLRGGPDWGWFEGDPCRG